MGHDTCFACSASLASLLGDTDRLTLENVGIGVAVERKKMRVGSSALE